MLKHMADATADEMPVSGDAATGTGAAKKDKRIYLSSLRAVLVALVLSTFVFTFAFTIAWGAQVDRLAAISSSDIFASLDLDTLDGGHVTSENLKGARVTMFNVWSTTCSPCISEMPGLEELSHSYPDGEIQLFGILSDGSNAEGVPNQAKIKEAVKIMDKAGATFPTLIMDKEAYAFIKTNIAGTPTTYFVDQDGTIIKSTAGAKNLEQWKQYVNEVLASLDQQ